MTNLNPTTLTQQDLRNASPEERVELLERYLLASIAPMRSQAGEPFHGGTRLADLGIDSLQVVELKFGLDQALGEESDVGLIIANPTIHELAEQSLRASGLLP